MPMVMAAYPVSAINPEADFGRSRRRQSRLDVEDHEQSRRPARRFRRAGRQRRNGAGGAGGSGQHDRPSAGYRAAAVGDRRAGRIGSDQPEGSLSFVAVDGSKRMITFARIAGTQSRLIISIDEARVSAAINREIRTAYLQLGVRLPVRAARRPDRRGEADHPADRDDGGDGEAVRPGRMVGARRAQAGCRRNSCRWPAPSTRWRRSSASASANWSPPMTG